MSLPRQGAPEFVLEALSDEVSQSAGAPSSDLNPNLVAVERLPELLEPVPMSPAGLSRLLGVVSELPLRYAPLFDQLSALWDLPERDVQSVLERAKDSRAWRRPPLPGLELMTVKGGPRTAGAEVYLARFAAGASFPGHHHVGHEDVLLLEGSYQDSSGHLYSSGDVHHMAAGSAHAFTITPDEPCVAAAVHHGIRFSSAWLRLLAKFFG